jgi:hypothetical protein
VATAELLLREGAASELQQQVEQQQVEQQQQQQQAQQTGELTVLLRAFAAEKEAERVKKAAAKRIKKKKKHRARLHLIKNRLRANKRLEEQLQEEPIVHQSDGADPAAELVQTGTSKAAKKSKGGFFSLSPKTKQALQLVLIISVVLGLAFALYIFKGCLKKCIACTEHACYWFWFLLFWPFCRTVDLLTYVFYWLKQCFWWTYFQLHLLCYPSKIQYGTFPA